MQDPAGVSCLLFSAAAKGGELADDGDWDSCNEHISFAQGLLRQRCEPRQARSHSALQPSMTAVALLT